MRLLNVETLRFDDFFGKKPPPYAILSHTWGEDSEEVSFEDVDKTRLGTLESRYTTLPIKLSGCCNQAKIDGLKYIWVDTCCINKASAVELQEAITSMFRWYQEAAVCYAFLSDVSATEDPCDPESTFYSSRWFKRGWTLQELLAPVGVRFYDRNWCYLGTKGDLCEAIENITNIPKQFLLGIAELHEASVAQRMSWAARRNTKRKEDMAYCLLGIFRVSMTMRYGEGDTAFRRLQMEIMRDISDDSILAWGLDMSSSPARRPSTSTSEGILAASPSDFASCSQITSRDRSTARSFDVQFRTLRIQLNLLTLSADEAIGLLTCGPELDPDEMEDDDRVIGIPLAPTPGKASDEYVRIRGRPSLLITMPKTQVSSKLVHIRIDGESKSPPALGQSYWLSVPKPVLNLEVIDVEPHSCWVKDNASIKRIAEPYGVKQRTWIRLRQKQGGSLDFVVLLEIEAQGSILSFGCHIMIASRETYLQNIEQEFGSLRPEVLGNHTASNGTLDVRVTVQPIMKQRLFVIKLDAPPTSPAVSINATSELHYQRLRVAIGCVEEAQEAAVRKVQERTRELEGNTSALDNLERELAAMRAQIKTLQEKEVQLAKDFQNTSQQVHVLRADLLETVRRQENLSAWRSELRRYLDDFWNQMPTRRALYERLVLERDEMIIWAVQHGHLDLLQPFLDFGGNISSCQEGYTLLHDAADRGHVTLVQLLLDRGADGMAKDCNGWTPLHTAARYGREAVIALLLDRGADVMVKDSDGWTPLYVATRCGHEAVVKLLLDRGADMTVKNRIGWTPLHTAAQNGHEAIIALLLDRGADIMAKDCDGWTPLHTAARNGHEAVIPLLLDRGADIMVKGSDGWTPLYVATRYGHEAVAKLLLDGQEKWLLHQLN